MQRKNLLHEQIRTTKTLLKDFSHIRQKCQMFCFKLGRQLPNIDAYQELQTSINQKIHQANHHSIIKMKQKLYNSIGELTKLQKDLSNQREKDKVINQSVKNIRKTDRPVCSSSSLANSNLSIPFSQTSIGELGLASKNGQFHKKKINDQNLPIYTVRKQSTEDKFDSINKFISKLRKNMKLQTQQATPEKYMQYLLLTNEYQQLKQQCQRLKMRNEQLPEIIMKEIQKGIKKFIENQQQVEANENYVMIKIPRNTILKEFFNNKQKTTSKNQTYSHPLQTKKLVRMRKSSNSSNNQFENMTFIKTKTQKNRPLLRRTNHFHKQLKQQSLYEPMYNCRMNVALSQVANNSQIIDSKLDDSETKIQSMIDSLAQSVNQSEMKILEIRSKRKQLQQDDIWKLIDEV